MKLAVLVSFILLLSICNLSAQEKETRVLTLEDCIDIALENNLNLKRAKNNALIAQSNKRQAILNYLPSIQGRINYDWFTGNNFDTNVGRIIQTTTNSSGPNINGNFTVFNGLRNHFNRKQMDNTYEASRLAVEDTKQQVSANLITYYLDVVVGRENIKISENRIDLLSQQLDRETKREEVGVGKLEEVYNLKSQIANEKINLITIKNFYERNRLLLLQALQVNDFSNIEIAAFDVSEVELNTEIDDYTTVINNVAAISPALKSANYNVNAAKNAVDVARSGRYPTISLFAQYGSNYSSNGAWNPETSQQEEDASFSDQLQYNKYNYRAFSVNIPIFSRGVTSNNIQVAKINKENAMLDLKQAEVALNNAVQQAYLDLVAAKTSYDAATENLTALDETFKFMQARYNSGNTDFYTYLESLNNKNRAESEMINAKYSIALRKKILNIYQGLD